MIEFKMPSLGADMEAGTLVAWQKRPGEAIHRGDIVAEVETDKGIIEIESFSDGVLDRCLAPVGVKVPVGTVLALFRENGATAPASPPESPPPSPIEAAPAAPSRPPPLELAPAAEHVAERLPMSPSARRLARELDVDPACIHGTGKGGAITREDVQYAAEAAHGSAPETPQSTSPPRTAAAPADRFARMRQTIAAAMSRSKREIPHYYLSTTIDMHPALTWLEEQNLKRPMTERLLPGVLLLKATALALHEVPELNATWESGQVVLQPQIHVGMAISMRQGGLIAPAIHDTDKKSPDQLMADLRDLIARARAGGLRSSELSDPTITVTSMGDQGVEAVFGVIYPPQVAIVGFGRVVERAWSINGGLLSRRVVTATLSADHRVSDGHRGGLFLSAIARLLQEPENL